MIPQDWFVFLLASIALSVSPGPDNLFVVTQGLAHGRAVAIASAWGMVSGVLVHTAAAALGVAALYQSFPGAFIAVKLLGVGYLLYLAGRMWFTTHPGKAPAIDDSSGNASGTRQGLWRWYGRGVLMNVLNPKVAIFFLSFLPQFVDTDVTGSITVGLQMMVLGLIFMLQAGIVFTCIGALAGSLGAVLQKHPTLQQNLNRFTAVVLLALAVFLLLG